MSFVQGLRCRECHHAFPAEALHVCEWCFGPLEVVYDYEKIAAATSRETIAAGPPSIWRYANLLPAVNDGAVDLGAGFTPLVRADRLAAELGLGELWLKNDTLNPTGSFKDRVVSVALARARAMGFKVAACASTGNLANSVAAHAARAGMRHVVFIPADLEAGKVVTTAVYGPSLIAVDGSYDDVNRLCAELASEQPTWAFVNVNLRTYYAEGSKTLAFETVEQLGLGGARPRGRARRLRLPAHQDRPGLPGAVQGRPAGGRAPRAHLRRPGRGLLAGGHRLQRGPRLHPPGEAQDHRQVPGHRQPGRRPLRPRRGQAQRRRAGGGVRPGDRRRHAPAGPHRGHLRRDRRRGHHRHPVPPGGQGRRPPRRAGRRLHHRRRPQDHRGGGARSARRPPPSRPPWTRSTPPSKTWRG